jgi:hypothetical protein
MATTTTKSSIYRSIVKWLDALNYSSADYQVERTQWVTSKISELERRIEQLEAPPKNEKIAA